MWYQHTKPRIHSLPEREKGHSGTETRPIRICGSSEESLTMGESLIMHFCVRYGIKDSIIGKADCRNPCLFLAKNRKTLVLFKRVYKNKQNCFEKSRIKSLANSVPAAAVIQRGKVLSEWTRHKKQVGCLFGSNCNFLTVQKNIKKQTFLNHSMGKGMALGLVE